MGRHEFQFPNGPGIALAGLNKAFSSTAPRAQLPLLADPPQPKIPDAVSTLFSGVKNEQLTEK